MPRRGRVRRNTFSVLRARESRCVILSRRRTRTQQKPGAAPTQDGPEETQEGPSHECFHRHSVDLRRSGGRDARNRGFRQRLTGKTRNRSRSRVARSERRGGGTLFYLAAGRRGFAVAFDRIRGAVRVVVVRRPRTLGVGSGCVAAASRLSASFAISDSSSRNQRTFPSNLFRLTRVGRTSANTRASKHDETQPEASAIARQRRL